MNGEEKLNIQHPEAWELLVSIDGKRLNYILYTPAVANSLIIGEVTGTDDSLQSLEDAIYDTPELLNEYKRVRVVVNSPHYVFLPQATDDEDCKELVRHAFPDDDGDVVVSPLPLSGVKQVFMMPHGMSAFLGRTFNYPVVLHHLTPLCEYFKGLDRGHGIAGMFLYLNAGAMDMAIYRDGEFQCANTYRFTDIQDAAYFALNAWRTNGMDQLADELQLTGEGDLCAQMTPVLREYVKYVMPVVFPAAAMRLGRNAMQAPLDLILLALCE